MYVYVYIYSTWIYCTYSHIIYTSLYCILFAVASWWPANFLRFLTLDLRWTMPWASSLGSACAEGRWFSVGHCTTSSIGFTQPRFLTGCEFLICILSEYHKMLILDGICMLFLDDVMVCWWVFFVNICHPWWFQLKVKCEHLIIPYRDFIIDFIYFKLCSEVMVHASPGVSPLMTVMLISSPMLSRFKRPLAPVPLFSRMARPEGEFPRKHGCRACQEVLARETWFLLKDPCRLL